MSSSEDPLSPSSADRSVTVGLHRMPPVLVGGLVEALGDAGVDAIRTGDSNSPHEAVDVHLVMVSSVRESGTLIPDAGAPACALVAEPFEDLGLLAVRAGALSVAPWDSSMAHVVRMVELALAGHGVLPAPVVHLMRAGMGSLAPTWLSQDEHRWLGQLSQGATIAEIAEAAGYSERSMYRVLYRLYTRLGARNRSEAVAVASRWA